MSRRVRKPVILLGAGRSGTSLLGRIFSRHPEVAYMGEPRPIWMYGHAYRADHVLCADDATPRIARYIDDRFAEFLAREGKGRFAEKTPSNCLRIPFIHAIYPDCRIIHIVRDGRDVVRSTLRIRERRPRKGIMRSRLVETPLWEWPGYIPMFFRTVWRTNVLRKPARHWGAQPPGWRDWVDMPPHLAVAHQWKALVEYAIRDGRALPPENYLEVRYEAFVADHARWIERMAAFAGLERSTEMVEFASLRIDPGRPKRDTLSEKQEQEVSELLRPTLELLGYA